MSRHSSPSTDHPPSNLYRLVVLGGGAVGKTALLKRFLEDEFVEKHRETVEDLLTKTFDVNGQLLQAHILDTAGNMSFPAMRRLSIGNGNAFLLVYSVASQQSFKDMKVIFEEIKTTRGQITSEFRSLPIVIAANKCDLPLDTWEVSRQQVDEFMLNETLDCHAAHLETSAKTGYNVLAIFETFVRLSPMALGHPSIAKGSQNRSSRADVFYQNGTGPNTNKAANGGSTSPLRRKQRPPPTQRRFSLQALTLTGNSNPNPTTDSATATPYGSPGACTPTLDMRRGSATMALGYAVRRAANMRPFMRRQKTKSHEDLEVPECYVQ